MTPRILVCCFTLLLWSSTRSASAQDPGYVLSMEEANPTVVVGNQVTQSFMLDNSVGGGVSGWSWGICQDNANLDISGVADGPAALTSNGGNPAAFIGYSLFPGAGWTVGVIVSFGTGLVLPPATDHELHVATYNTTAIGTTNLSYCSDLSNPVVFLTITNVAGTGLIPTTFGSLVTIEEGPPPFTFRAPSNVLSYDADTGIGSVTVPFSITENPLNPTFPTSTTGYTMAVANDGPVMPTAVEFPPAVQALNGGAGPAFVGADFNPNNGLGFTLGVTYSFVGGASLAYSTQTTVVRVTYETDAAQLIGDEVGTTSALTFDGAVTAPDTSNEVGASGTAFNADTINGTLFLSPLVTLEFVRGDCNVNNFLDLGDAIWILNFLFQGGSQSACPVACDSNDDNLLDQSDVVYLLNYFFLGGPNPPAPFPDCGIDQIGDECGSYSFCN